MTNENIKLFPHDHVLRRTIIPLIPRWIRPNHITVFRIIATPFVLAVLLFENYTWGMPFFILVACTDAVDGSLARLRKQITAWGTIADPVADKILIGGILLFIVIQHINLYFGLVLVGLELIALIGGWLKKRRGIISSPNVFGKTKMILQVCGIGFLLIALWSGISLFVPFSIGTLSLAIVFAVIALFTSRMSF